jgi:hypothetical protein
MPQNLSAQFVCPSPTMKKASLGVRSPCTLPRSSLKPILADSLLFLAVSSIHLKLTPCALLYWILNYWNQKVFQYKDYYVDGQNTQLIFFETISTWGGK